VLDGLTFVNPGYRTSSIFNLVANLKVSGCDFSGFSQIAGIGYGNTTATFTNCVLPSTAFPVNTAGASNQFSREIVATNCWTADSPAMAHLQTVAGVMNSSLSVYRNDGATVESVPFSWKVDTSAITTEHSPFTTAWIYGATTAGTRTFSVAIAHSDAGSGTGGFLTDAQAWIEVEYMLTEDSGLYTLATDKRVTITTAPADQATDGASSWTGSPGADLQILSKQVTVGEAGLYRVRAAFGVASKTIYVDPKVTVT
jgi:hypothetical protein